MCLPRIKRRAFHGVLLFLLAVNLWMNICACGFMDLRPMGIHTFPSEEETVLPGEYSRVILSFDTEMDRQKTEALFQINSSGVSVEGDLSWDGNRLSFVPVPGWTPGTRYALVLSGTVYSLDGRELRLDRYVPFYAVHKNPPPLLVGCNPADGASTRTGDLGSVSGSGPVLELRFSRPMEKLSAQAAFTLEGVGEKKYEWLDNDTVLRVTPEKTLSPWKVYRWTVSAKAMSRDGVPLAKEFSARFSTDLDQLMPKLEMVYPVLLSGGRWIPSGGAIETDLGPAQGIALGFNKPMGESVLRSLTFEPSLAGRTESLSEKSIVFIPNKDPEPGINYCLIVSADTKDAEGLRLGTESRSHCIPDSPYLKILSFNDTDDPVNGSLVSVQSDIAKGEVLTFTIRFSLPFNAEAKQNAALSLSFLPFFPQTLEPTALRFVNWLSDDRLCMEWEGFTPGTSAEAHYYRLLIPGGKGGVDNGGGMYFKEDQILILEAMQ
jgi:hypothetical protein